MSSLSTATTVDESAQQNVGLAISPHQEEALKKLEKQNKKLVEALKLTNKLLADAKSMVQDVDVGKFRRKMIEDLQVKLREPGVEIWEVMCSCNEGCGATSVGVRRGKEFKATCPNVKKKKKNKCRNNRRQFDAVAQLLTEEEIETSYLKSIISGS